MRISREIKRTEKSNSITCILESKIVLINNSFNLVWKKKLVKY